MMICMMLSLDAVQHRRVETIRGTSVWTSALRQAVRGLTIAILLSVAFAANPATADDEETTGPLLTKCKDQTYALCASSECTVFDGVAYCKCRVRHGTSISLTQPFDDEDVCDINAQGVGNGYIVSTYSPPPQLLAPSGDLAIYHCTGTASSGAYAQCDGGLCYRSTQGQFFPGFKGQLQANQIICSCPIITATAVSSKVGHEIFGPYPCNQSWFRFCEKDVSNSKNASTLYVGAPSTFGFEFVTNRFLGRKVSLKTCAPPN